MLNKTPINDDELESGLVRLTQGGLITQRDSKFLPTGKIPDDLRNHENPKNMEERQRIETFLDAEQWSNEKNVGDPRNNLKYSGLTREKIIKADRVYHKRVSKQIWEMFHKDK